MTHKPGPEHRLTVTNGHGAVSIRSHWSGCFSIITAGMPDAVGAAGKPMEDVCSRLIARVNTVEVDRPERSPKADFTTVLVLRSEELGRTAYMDVQPTHGTVQDSHSPRS